MERQINAMGIIESELKKYNITNVQISDFSNSCMALKVRDISDHESYKIVKQARIKTKNKRVEVEKTRKELKAESLRFGKAVDMEARRITSLLLPIENYLISQEKIVDDEKERIKAELEQLERERIEKEEVVKKKLEEERQAKIREEQETEAKRLENIRKEQEARELKIKDEQEKIRKQQEVYSRKIREEEKRIAALLAKEQEVMELERVKVEAVKKAQRDAEQKVIREATEKRKAEEQEKKDEELRINLLPDKEKLFNLAGVIESVSMPKLAYRESHDVLDNAKEYLRKACNVLRDKEAKNV